MDTRHRHPFVPAWVVPAIALPALLSCATPRSAQTPQEQAYLSAAMAQSTTFTVAAEDADAAWSRALKWVEQYSAMGIRTNTETTIDTFDPPPGSATTTRSEYGYAVQRQPGGDGYTVSVRCTPNESSLSAQAEQNAHLLAYFIATGRPTPSTLVE